MTMVYAQFNESGLPVAFFFDETHGPRVIDKKPNPDCRIPADAVLITIEQWQDMMSHQGRRRWNGSAVVEVEPLPIPVTGNDINAERGRRILAGKVIEGVHVTGSDEDARNLMSLALGAQMRLAAGDTETVTTFRDGENVDHRLIPAELLSLWQQSAEYVSALYAASWALKEMEPIPADFASDGHWPD